MPRASAKAKASAASNEEQELIRLRKELMEKQATLKRALAAGKRQKTGGGGRYVSWGQGVSSVKNTFGGTHRESSFLTPKLTRPRFPTPRSHSTQAPVTQNDDRNRNQG